VSFVETDPVLRRGRKARHRKLDIFRFDGAINEAATGFTMQVDIIETLEGFAALQPVWDAVHAQDPESGYFLSWQWLDEVFRANPDRWRVMAVKPEAGADYVCFFPLKLKTRWSESSQEFSTELEAGGKLSWGQYTGFVCHPEWEDRAISALAATLRDMPWARLSLRYNPCQRRSDLLLHEFAGDDYRISHKQHRINDGTVDNLLCPRLRLPDDYETYLQSSLSSNTRQKLRRFWRKFEAAPDLRITDSTAGSHERDLDILLDLWLRRWAEPRGRRSAERVVKKYREIFAQSHALGAVHIPVLWQDDRPLGALANIVDHRKNHLYFIASGRDESVRDPNVGLLLHAHNIRWAIDRGIGTYDFCHGNEGYKHSFGATDQPVGNFVIRRRTDCAVGRLDPAHVGYVMKKTIGLLEDNRIDSATKACRQVLPLLVAG
jgi:CelD/BcsL family acetyltransferase involved in cellulose biosynthesis